MKRLFCVLMLLLVISCGSPSSKKTDSGCGERTPPDMGFKTDIAWIVVEWNCKPAGYGSGFLVDREHGAFYTNKHVSNMFNSYGKGSHKIFFNGKFYNIEIVKVPPLRDAALIRITDSFDPSEFPEPAPFATTKAKKGDTIFVEGFHPHPYSIIESNKAESYEERLVFIWEKYYNLGTKNLDKRQEVVFERFSAKVSEVDSSAKLEENPGVIDQAREIATPYIMAKADKDHKFSFGGLSGTVVRNPAGEIVGIFTVGLSSEFEKTEKVEGVQYAKPIFKTFGLGPIESIEDLKEYLERPSN